MKVPVLECKMKPMYVLWYASGFCRNEASTQVYEAEGKQSSTVCRWKQHVDYTKYWVHRVIGERREPHKIEIWGPSRFYVLRHGVMCMPRTQYEKVSTVWHCQEPAGTSCKWSWGMGDCSGGSLVCTHVLLATKIASRHSIGCVQVMIQIGLCSLLARSEKLSLLVPTAHPWWQCERWSTQISSCNSKTTLWAHPCFEHALVRGGLFEASEYIFCLLRQNRPWEIN